MAPPKLAQYAVISRQWQAIVERIIWQQISVVKLGSVEKLHQFTSGDSYRRARAGYIRHILWWPKIEWGDFIAKFQGNDELYAGYYQQCLSSIRNIFQLLSSWEGQLSDISLSFWLGDNDYLSITDEEIEQEVMESLTLDQLCKMSRIPHLLHLTANDFQDIPTLPFIKSFRLHDYEGTVVRPSVFFHILNCFPHVKHVSFGEYVIYHLSLVPDSVETFTYSIAPQRELALNPARDAAKYLPANGLDEFSSTFRSFSMRLKEVHLEDFRRRASTRRLLYWPNLEILEILEIPPNLPDDWEGDIEENFTEPWEYDSEYYAKRGLIKSSQVDKLYKAMGHAAQKMPRLRRLKFSFRGEIGEAGSNEYLDFSRDLATGRTRLNINTEWQYTIGEGLIST
ncbi:uncharacterized protein ASPGLDRAFT_78010 [Aspergillus glaucus CBS 516.65]|uniref:F-box domain-containing protein n=1 Tax=Aspergillus glaucus CBS 516.65 TaxID=1160497 RepID=A0A1L9V4H3_ASPGL|nr:hypothetical protein ASPGLDRAFT_78010 [Aspergillus glaucus CBS 516.65]OJJ78801.1 hypothetical protein ASPGLDRAFT_78010 [Aspergillus glaucus CBS 516.65]